MARQQPTPLAAQNVLAQPAAAKPVADAVGNSASPAALARLDQAVAELKAKAVLPILQRALLAMSANRHQEGAEVAIKALEIDEHCALGWHILAICREQAGDFSSSLKCYEKALQLNPEDPSIANDLGRLAYRLGMKDTAAALFAHFLAREPDSPDGANNLACALRDQLQFSEAIEVLRPAINAHPQNAMLWNTLGTVINNQGEMEQALTFFDEALRLDPKMAKARYNRANCLLALGEPAKALVECEAALKLATLESDVLMMQLARSTMLIACGRLGEGWDAYEARLDEHFSDVTHFLVERPRWVPGAELKGKRLLLVGEQGLGDEVLFANMIPDVLEALGPDGRLILALEPRLVPLFRRSFPAAEIGPHATFNVEHHTVRVAPFVKDTDTIDFWAPLASPLRQFRRSVEDYPDRPSFLTADPVRVEHWRGLLAETGPGPKAGIVWKSIKIDGGRFRHYSPFEHWRPVLTTPGVTFVNLQYGESAAELEEARASLGVEIWNPPGIDLKNDLDDVAALSCALDLVIGPANATTNIAAACGAPVWLISTPGAWPKLGTERYPWYPQARVFTAHGHQWQTVMVEVAAELTGLTK